MATITLGTKTYPLVSLPSSPAPANVEWGMTDNIGINKSPFSLDSQTYDWQAAILSAKVTMPRMTHAQAQPWKGFFAGSRGIQNVFLFGDYKALTPQGTGGTFSVGAANQSGFQLATSAGIGQVLSGDWIMIGSRLYCVTANLGSGSLNIWPNLRESPPSGATVVTTNTQGVFRLAKNARSFQQGITTYGFSFEIEEVI